MIQIETGGKILSESEIIEKANRIFVSSAGSSGAYDRTKFYAKAFLLATEEIKLLRQQIKVLQETNNILNELKIKG